MSTLSLEHNIPFFSIAADSVRSRRQTLIDVILLIILLLLTVYVVYFTSQAVARIYFLVLLALFLFSKKDYFWFAFFFIIISEPGWLFSDFSGASTTRLPLYTFLSGMSFSSTDLFFIIALIKALVFGRKFKFRLRNPLLLVLFYGIFLMLLSFFVYGVNLDSFLPLLRSAFTFSVIISFSFLVYRRTHIYRFIYLIFPIVFFILFTEMYYLATGGFDLINLLSPGYRPVIWTEAGALRPVTGGAILLFVSYVFSFFLLQLKQKRLTKYYLALVCIASFFAVFLSATRVWIVMFSFIALCSVLFSKRVVSRFLQLSIAVALLIIVTLSVAPLRTWVLGSLNRVSEIGSVAQGRYSEVQTFESRFHKILPRVLIGLRQNWILGWGFSDTYRFYEDGHVGNFNLLLQVGVIGFSLFVYFWIKYFRMVLGAARRIRKRIEYRNALLVLVYAFGAMLIAHFSTYAFFGYTIVAYNAFFLSIFIAISELSLKQAFIHGSDYCRDQNQPTEEMPSIQLDKMMI